MPIRTRFKPVGGSLTSTRYGPVAFTARGTHNRTACPSLPCPEQSNLRTAHRSIRTLDRWLVRRGRADDRGAIRAGQRTIPGPALTVAGESVLRPTGKARRAAQSQAHTYGCRKMDRRWQLRLVPGHRLRVAGPRSLGFLAPGPRQAWSRAHEKYIHLLGLLYLTPVALGSLGSRSKVAERLGERAKVVPRRRRWRES